jgi:hypothetical protein
MHTEAEESLLASMQQNEENVPPNSAARRKKNPFKSNERMAFPPLDEALAFSVKDKHKSCPFSDNGKADGSPGVNVLTISMQALLHPDSFHSTSFSSSVEADDGEDSAQAEWEAGCLDDIVSPERDPDMPACLLTEDGWEDQDEGESDSDAEPCMADIFEALQLVNRQLSPVHSQNDSISESQERDASLSPGFAGTGIGGASVELEQSWINAHDMSDVACCPATPVCKQSSPCNDQTPRVQYTCGPFDAARTPSTPASALRVRDNNLKKSKAH